MPAVHSLFTAVPLLGLLIGCGGADTGLVVVVRSDLQVPEVLASVRVTVRQDGAPAITDFLLDREPKLSVPFSFVVDSPSPSTTPVVVLLQARSPDRTVLFAREVQTRLRPGSLLLLPVALDQACWAQRCAATVTCTDRGCGQPTIDSSTLDVLESRGAELSDPG